MLAKTLVICTAFCCAVNAQAQPPADSAAIAHTIIDLEQKLADALPGDSATWSRYLDPQFYMVDENGTLSSRKEFLAEFAPFPKDITGKVLVTRPALSFHGNIVVIHYVADENEGFFGQHLHTTYGTMTVWYKTDTAWRLLSMQDFEIPALPPAITVPARDLQQFAGTYAFNDTTTAVVSVQNDTLFLQKKARKKEALLAETPTVFFRNSDARGRKVFARDPNGIMVMRERRNGQDIVWQRIKQ